MAGLVSDDSDRFVGLVTRNSCDYFERFFELVSRGVSVVPLRSSDDHERINACGVTEVITPTKGAGWIDLRGALPSDSSIAQVAFTSGTQGEPKGIILTRANMSSTTQRLREFMELDSSIREYVGVPVYLSFGLGRCLAVASAGGRSFIPEGGFDPHQIAEMLRNHEINAISAVPSLWRVLLQRPEVIGELGKRVRWIEIGSQSMPVDEKRAMRRLFPNAKIVQHYGLTEASRSTFLDVGLASDEQLASVGKPYGDVELTLDHDNRVMIRGSNVAAVRLEQGRRVENVDNHGWFTTGDIGEIKGGLLYFKGRADDVINLGGIKVSADSLQQRVSETFGPAESVAVARVSDPLRGEGILLALTEDCAIPESQLVAMIDGELKQRSISAASSIHVMRFPSFPYTASGKLQRHVLAARFEEANRPSVSAHPPQRRDWKQSMQMAFFKKPESVLDIYQKIFPGRRIQSTDSFVGLGGDSLTYVEASIALESKFGMIPKNWQEKSVAELEAISPRKGWVKPVDTTIFLRFVCIVVIVAFHFSPFSYGGATFLLFVVAGYNFSRFQLPKVLENDSVRSILLSAGRIALPTVLMLLLVQTAITGYSADILFLFSNFFVQDNWHALTWYVEVLVQILIVLSVVLAFPWIRELARSGAYRFTAGFFLLSLLLAMLGPLVWDTAYLKDHVPHMILWIFLMGCLLEQSVSPPRKLAAAVAIFLSPLAVWGASGQPEYVYYGIVWVWVGAAVLLGFDRILLPVPVNVVAYWIGGASLFIYITHWYVPPVLRRGFMIDNYLADIVVSLVVGVVAWIGWELLTRVMLQHWQRRGQVVVREQ